MWEIFQELRGQPLERPKRLARTARAQLNSLRDRGAVRLWKIETQTLSRVGEALSQAPELPVVGRLSDAAEDLVNRRLGALTANPIPDYASLNAKEAARRARDIRKRVELLALERAEQSGKNRKTVLDAIAETLGRLGKLESAEA